MRRITPILILLLGVFFSAATLATEHEENFFATQETDATTDEQPLVTNASGCYDLTHDLDQAICLDPEISILQEQMERQYSIRLANAPLSQKNALQRAHNTWQTDTKFSCGNDVLCARVALQKHLLSLHQAKTLFRKELTLKEGTPPILIGVTGRDTKDGYLLHSMLHFEIDKYGKEKTKERFDFYHLMRSNHYELLHPRPSPYLLDANFDGWLDLVFLTGERAQDINRIYLLFDPEEGTFTTNRLLNSIHNPVFITDYKLVSSNWAKDGAYGTNYYKYNNTHELKLDVRTIYSQTPNTAGKNQIIMNTFSNRTGRMSKVDSYPITMDALQEGNVLPALYTDTTQDTTQ